MKRNGFVLIETVVVMSVLSVTLIMLYASYSYILRKSQVRNVYDTTEMLYKTFYLKKQIDSLKPIGDVRASIDYFIETHKKSNGSMCFKMGKFNSYECDLKNNPQELSSFKIAFEIEKFYVVTPSEIFKSSEKNDWFNMFDATTIDYLMYLGESKTKRLMIVKYKQYYGKIDGKYEIYHSSLEV